MKFISLVSLGILLFVCVLVSGNAQLHQPKLLFYLSFDNNSLKPEISAGDGNGQVKGHIEFTPGYKGSAGVFTNGNFLSFKAPGNFNPEAGTIEMHFKLLPAINGNYRRHLLTFYTNESERFYLRQITKNSFMTYGFGGGGFSFFDNPKGAWHHIALCWKWDPKTNKRHVTIYLDGFKKVDCYARGKLPEFLKGRIILGAYGVKDLLLSLNGLLDEFKIYDDVIYTKDSYPEFFIYPPVSKLEKRLSLIKEGVDIISSSMRKRKAIKIYNSFKARIDQLKKGNVKDERYFKEYYQIKRELKNVYETVAAAALWWRNRPIKDKDFAVIPISCMKKITDRWVDAPKKAELPKLACAGNEWTAFQLVILPRFEDILNCYVSMSGFVRADIGNKNIENENVDNKESDMKAERDIDIKLFRVGTVRQKGDMRIWADPLYPITKRFSVKADRIQPIWIQIYVPAKMPAGVYKSKIVIQAQGRRGRYEFPVELRVYGFDLPVRSQLKTAFGFAMTPLVHYYKGKKYRPIAKKYLANMLEHKVSIKTLWLHGIYYDTTFLAPKIIKTSSGKWKMLFDDYDRQLDELLPLGLNTIMVGYRSWDGNWRTVKDKSKAIRYFPYYDEADAGRVKKLKLPVLSTETEKFGKWVISNWYGHLKKRGLADLAYTYFVDEPSADMMQMIETICRWAHEVAPDLKNMITHEPVESCLNVDIWCPLAITPEVRKYVKSGGTIWKYVCCAPLSPHPNFFINQTALENRLPFWVAYQAGAKGFLYYETGRSLAMKKIDEEYVSLKWANAPGTEGDGFLVYPGKDRPINTIRFEYIRLGIQDIEYFLMLKELIQELPKTNELRKQADTLLTVDDLIKGSAHYCKGWDKYQLRKEQIGLMIEQIVKLRGAK